MAEFGWHMEYVFGLTLPVFMYFTNIIHRLRGDSAYDTVYLAYTAGKYGKDCFDTLRKIKGTFYLEPESYKYTDDDLARARAKATARQAIYLEKWKILSKKKRGVK